MNRDCNNCIYSARNGTCRTWKCKGTKTVEDIRSDTIEECKRVLSPCYDCEVCEDKPYFEGSCIECNMSFKEVQDRLNKLKEQANDNN